MHSTIPTLRPIGDAITTTKRSIPAHHQAEIIKALKAHRVSPALVSNVLHRAGNGSVKRGATGLPVETLIAAKELANRLGGLEAARAALNVLERLGA